MYEIVKNDNFIKYESVYLNEFATITGDIHHYYTVDVYLYDKIYKFKDANDSLCITCIEQEYGIDSGIRYSRFPEGIIIQYINSETGNAYMIQGLHSYPQTVNPINHVRLGSYIVDFKFSPTYEELLEEYDSFKVGFAIPQNNTKPAMYAYIITDHKEWKYSETINNGILYNEAYLNTWKYLRTGYKKRTGKFASKLYYTVYVDDNIIFSSDGIDPNYTLINPELNISVNNAGNFKFAISPTHPFYDKINLLSSTIVIEKNGDLYWEGRVLTEEIDFFNRKTIYCEGDLSYLNDVILLQNDFTKMTASQIFYFIMKYYNKKATKERKFTIGSCPDIYVEGTFYSDYETTLSVLERLVEKIDGIFYVERQDNKKILHIYTKEDAYITSNQSIFFGTNLLDYTRNYDANDIATVLIPLGTKSSSITINEEVNLIGSALNPYVGKCDSDGTNFTTIGVEGNIKSGSYSLTAGSKYRIVSALPNGNGYANYAIVYKDGPPIGKPTATEEGSYTFIDETFTATNLMTSIIISSDTQVYKPGLYLVDDTHTYNGYSVGSYVSYSSSEYTWHYCKEWYYETETEIDEETGETKYIYNKKSRFSKVNYYPLTEENINTIINDRKTIDSKNNSIAKKQEQIAEKEIDVQEKYDAWQENPDSTSKENAYYNALEQLDKYRGELATLESEKATAENEISSLETKTYLDPTFYIYTFNLNNDNTEKRYFVNTSVMNGYNFYLYVMFLEDGTPIKLSDVASGVSGQTTLSYEYIEIPSYVRKISFMSLNRQSSFSLYSAIEQEEEETVTYSDKLTIASVNNDSIYLLAPPREVEIVDKSGNVTTTTIDPVTAYGRIEKIYEVETEDAEYLKEKGEKYLTNYQFDNMSINIDVIDLIALGTDVNSLDIYQNVNVYSPIHGLNKLFPLDEMKINIANPAKSSITMNNERTDISLTGNKY